MESNSKANRILCSEQAYKILSEQAPDLSVRKRGKIAVKGKGDMVTYWVGDQEITAATSDIQQALCSTHEEDDGEVQETKRVDFAEPTEGDVVDENLWRRDLQHKLTHMDSSAGDAQKKNKEQPPLKKQSRVVEEKAPATKTTKGKKNVTLSRSRR